MLAFHLYYLYFLLLLLLHPFVRINSNATSNNNIDDDVDYDNNSNDDGKLILPQETQKAQCTVTAGEIKASAEATMTKTLEGVCGSKELDDGLQEIESNLMAELEDIKELLIALLKNTSGGNNNSIIKKLEQKKKRSDPLSSLPPSSSSLSKMDKNNKTKIERNQKLIKLYRNREQEVKKLNNTMSSGGELKLFSYYWQLENFASKLHSTSFEYSPSFTILGKPMRIKAIYNHLNRDMLFLKLEQDSTIEKRDKYKSIMLDTGDVFKQIKDQLFIKYKLAILDQVNPATDLVSNELTNTSSGFLIPHSAILTNSYSKNDKVLIKLIIYL